MLQGAALVCDVLSRVALAPISKVTLSVAVQQNKELERQQAVIQQVTYPAVNAQHLQKKSDIAAPQLEF